MKILKYLAISYALAGCGFALAQEAFVGTWQGNMELDAENSLTVQFIFEQSDDGSYAAKIHTPSSSISNMTASSIEFEGNSVRLEFASLSGTFEGEIEGEDLSGEWSQPGSTFPLVLNPYVIYAPDEATIDMLIGMWHMEGNENTLFAFGRDAEGNLVGARSAPSQGPQAIGALGGYGILYSQFTFTFGTDGGPRFLGDVTESAMEGTMDGRPMKFVKVESSSQRALNLTEAEQNTLLGSWRADLGPYSLAVRFQRNPDGDFAAYFGSPSQGAEGIPITEISVTGDQISLVAPAYAEFSGTISRGELVGEWTQGSRSQPLTFTKN